MYWPQVTDTIKAFDNKQKKSDEKLAVAEYTLQMAPSTMPGPATMPLFASQCLIRVLFTALQFYRCARCEARRLLCSSSPSGSI
jgi:hypothetical protein